MLNPVQIVRPTRRADDSIGKFGLGENPFSLSGQDLFLELSLNILGVSCPFLLVPCDPAL